MNYFIHLSSWPIAIRISVFCWEIKNISPNTIKTTVISPANLSRQWLSTAKPTCPTALVLGCFNNTFSTNPRLNITACMPLLCAAGNIFKFTDPTSLSRPLRAGGWRSFLISRLLSAETLHSMLSSYGRNNLPSPFSDRHSLQSASSPISSLLSSHFTSPSLLPTTMTRLSSSSPTRDEPPFPYHPAAFASYQNSMKLKKKKQRTTKIGPDGIPLKRKSREGSTTYLWEFLLKLLQVRCLEWLSTETQWK